MSGNFRTTLSAAQAGLGWRPAPPCEGKGSAPALWGLLSKMDWPGDLPSGEEAALLRMPPSCLSALTGSAYFPLHKLSKTGSSFLPGTSVLGSVRWCQEATSGQHKRTPFADINAQMEGTGHPGPTRLSHAAFLLKGTEWSAHRTWWLCGLKLRGKACPHVLSQAFHSPQHQLLWAGLRG